jgi:drug/metabolite transporter (DMT)-like permease
VKINRTVAAVEATLAVVIWGASFIATKLALRELAPVVLVWLRFAMGVAVLGLAVAARRQFALPSRKEVGYFALLGFIGITFHQWLQSTALQTSLASTTAWILAASPVFMAALGWLVLREKLGAQRVLGIALAAAGVLLVVARGDWRALSIGRFGAPGDVLILISALNWAVFSVLSRPGLLRHPATRMMFYVITAGWILSTPLLWTGPGLSQVRALSAAGWLAVGFLGVFCSGLAYVFWYDALKAMPASQLGVFLYLEPLVTLLVAAVVLGEAAVWSALAGGATILLGVWLVNRAN